MLSMPKRSSRPTPYGHTAMARFLAKRIDELTGRKSRLDIARALGYENPNIISMFKTGDTKVPLDKIPALADALEVDVGELLRLGLEAYWPEKLAVIQKALVPITQPEAAILGAAREAAGGTALLPLNKERLRLLKRILAEWFAHPA